MAKPITTEAELRELIREQNELIREQNETLRQQIAFLRDLNYRVTVLSRRPTPTAPPAACPSAAVDPSAQEPPPAR